MADRSLQRFRPRSVDLIDLPSWALDDDRPSPTLGKQCGQYNLMTAAASLSLLTTQITLSTATRGHPSDCNLLGSLYCQYRVLVRF